jgi:hypothetical protein
MRLPEYLNPPKKNDERETDALIEIFQHESIRAIRINQRNEQFMIA